MRVTRLHLQGFKSFASATDVDLSGGITAVVGPNGSGKSNLVDAIRLVLGGASARELRGGRLEEVIFSGGERRAPQGMAEVSISFDNEDGRIPVEDTEVSLTRRVFRDGASEFRRNGTRVRMRDVGRMLEATGLTQAGYAIIAQNDIEAIIRANPGQRRHLIEEAAGIRGAQAMLEDGRQRLGALDHWLEGSGGRLAELLPRIEELRAEAELAEQAAELRRRLRALRGNLERSAWLAAVAEAQRLDRQLQSARRRRSGAVAELQAYQVLYRAQREELERAERGRLARERRLGVLALARQRLEAEAALWGERALQAVRDRQEGARQLRQALDDLGALGQIGPEVEEGQPGPDPRVAELAGRETRVREMEKELSRLATVAAEAGAEARRWAGMRSEGERRLERLRARAEATALDQLALARRAAETADEERRMREALGPDQERQVAAEREAEAAAERLEADRTAETSARELLAQLEAGLTESLTGERRAAAAAAALEAQISVAERGRPLAAEVSQGRLQMARLADALKPRAPVDARAIDAALGPLAEALVGEEAEARRALALAGGAAELVAWGTERPLLAEAEPPPGCRPLAETVSGGEAEVALVRRSRPWVCLAENRRAAAGWLLRWPLGFAALPDGTLVGSGWERTPGGEGAIATRAQLRSLQAEAARWVARAAEARTQVGWAAAQHQRSRERVDQARAEVARHRGDAAALRLAVERREGALRDLGARGADLEREAGRLGQLLGQLQGEVTTTAADAQQAREAEAAAEALSASAGGARQALEKERAAASQGLEGLRDEVLQMEAGRRALAQGREERRERARELAARREAARQRISAAELAAVAALQSRARGEADLAVAVSDQASEDEAAAASRGSDRDPLQRLAELEGRRAELGAAETAAAAAVAEVERALGEQQRLAERLGAEIGEDGGDPLLAVEEEDPNRTAAEIARLERRIAQLGLVNELAPSQLADLLDRTEGLRRAHEDIQSARLDMEAIATSLGRLTEARYRQALGRVAGEFSSVWADLFGGGRAELASVPGEGEELPGVDLQVQPRGKRVMPLTLLSGGERALTALALVLALQQVAPSPFYVLDEVDAALDDANVGTFARLLRERSRASQFVLVTHNLTTMAAADQLYGVTQDGRGGSRVISVRLAEDGQALESTARREAFAIG